ncbi:MAG: acyltransferase [Phaeodactylibacter xiamenensis]|nr:acyltransferase [Phaeodactylibacter xiamenensis]MCR9055337.1 acyltransferase [bacterium]
MSTKKDYSVETLRGFAIILVVMGHVIGSGSDGA